MAKNNINLNVGMVLDSKDVPKQLKDLNAQLSKTNSTKIKFKLDTGQITTAIKEINQFNIALGKLKQVRIYDPQSGMQFKNDLVKIDEGLQIVEKSTSKYTNALGELVTKVKTVDSEGNVLIKQTKQYVTDLNEVVKETTLLDENLNQLGQTITETTSFTKNMTTTTDQVKTTIKEGGKELKALVTTITQMGSKGEYLKTVITEYTDAEGYAVKETKKLNEAGNQVATTETTKTKKIQENTQATKNNTSAVQENANTHQTLGQALAGAFTQLAKYYVASLPLIALRKALQETMTTLKEFDSALIEFRKVSDLAGESLTKYVAKLAEMGELTGSTMQAMVEASTQFRKSGFNDEDSAKLASLAEEFRNVADEEISAADSASFIIAQMKAFNIEAGEAEHILDAVNEV